MANTRVVSTATMTLDQSTLTLTSDPSQEVVVSLSPNVVPNGELTVRAVLPLSAIDKVDVAVATYANGAFYVTVKALAPLSTALIGFELTSLDPRFRDTIMPFLAMTATATLDVSSSDLRIGATKPATLLLSLSIIPTDDVSVELVSLGGVVASPRILTWAAGDASGLNVTFSAARMDTPLRPFALRYDVTSYDSRFHGIQGPNVTIVVLGSVYVGQQELRLLPSANALIYLTPNAAPDRDVMITAASPSEMVTLSSPLMLNRNSGAPIRLAVTAGLLPSARDQLILSTSSADSRFDNISIPPIFVTVLASVAFQPGAIQLQPAGSLNFTVVFNVAPSVDTTLTPQIPSRFEGLIVTPSFVTVLAGSSDPVIFTMLAPPTAIGTFEVSMVVTSNDTRFQQLSVVPLQVAVQAAIMASVSSSVTDNGNSLVTIAFKASVRPSSLVTVTTIAPLLATLVPAGAITLNEEGTASLEIRGLLSDLHAERLMFTATSADTRLNGIGIPALLLDLREHILAAPAFLILPVSTEGMLSLALSLVPSDNVTVYPRLDSDVSTFVDFDPPFLLFTPENGRGALNLTVKAQDTPNSPININLSATSSDLRFDQVTLAVPVTLLGDLRLSTDSVRLSSTNNMTESFDIILSHAASAPVEIVFELPVALASLTLLPYPPVVPAGSLSVTVRVAAQVLPLLLCPLPISATSNLPALTY
jgi:hypothetical protein